jgi:hypothetical protein
VRVRSTTPGWCVPARKPSLRTVSSSKSRRQCLVRQNRCPLRISLVQILLYSQNCRRTLL